jgi:hypothetical protein
MIEQLIYILIIAVVVGLIWWVCDYLPVPGPLNRLIKVLSIVIAVIAIILVLLRMAGVATTGLAAASPIACGF